MTLPGQGYTDEQVQVVARELAVRDGFSADALALLGIVAMYDREARRILDALARHAEEEMK